MPFAIEHIHCGWGPAASRDDPIRQGLCHGSVDDFGQKMADLHSCCHGCGKPAVDDAPFGGYHGNRFRTPVVVGYVRIKHAFHGHKHIGIGEIINHIASPIHLRRRTGKINRYPVSLHVNGRFDDDVILALHLFHNSFCLIKPVRHLFDGTPHAPLSTADNLICQVV